MASGTRRVGKERLLLRPGRLVCAFGLLRAIGLAFDFEDDLPFDQPIEESHRQRAIRQIPGMTTVASNSTAEFLVTYASAGVVTIAGLGIVRLDAMPVSQYVQNTAGTTATIAAGAMEG